MKPLAIDLYCGLGGWAEGLLAEDWNVIGFDIEEHVYGTHRYPGQLLIRDVTTLHGSWFKNADLFVASPPCQKYSYMAMPWKRAKAKAAAIRADITGAEIARLTRLFYECYRIQREACEAAGRHIPLIIENVRGAQPWVGKAAGKYGSFYLWGDVPALPPTPKAVKEPGFRFDGSGKSFQSASVEFIGTKVPSKEERRTDPGKGARFTSRDCGIEGAVLKKDGAPHLKLMPIPQSGRKGVGSGSAWFYNNQGQYSSKSSERKMASAMIAKIPLLLSRHIAATFKTPPSST